MIQRSAGSNDFFPPGFRRREGEFFDARAQALDVRRLVVSLVMRVARPAFEKQEFRRIISRDVQVVKQAPLLVPRWREYLGQGLP